jgi:hypothetical protein
MGGKLTFPEVSKQEALSNGKAVLEGWENIGVNGGAIMISLSWRQLHKVVVLISILRIILGKVLLFAPEKIRTDEEQVFEH